jgi:hypothetical protein
MAQDEAYDVRVVGRRTDDQGRTLVQETFWYKGGFYMTDRYKRADESTEKKAVEDAVSAPPNPAEDESVGATSAAEVPTLPVETEPAGCNLVETTTTTQPATTQEISASPDANRACVQPAKQTRGPAGTKADGGRRELPTPPTWAPTKQRLAVGKSPQLHVQSAQRAARGGRPVAVLSGSTARGQDALGAVTPGCVAPRAPVMKPTYTQRSSGSCWTQRT